MPVTRFDVAPPVISFTALPVKAPFIVSVFPLPTAIFPDVKVRAVWHTMQFPMVIALPPLTMNVAILFVVLGVVWLRYRVSAPAPPIVRLDVALPVRYWVADIPDIRPFSVNVFAPMVHVFAAPVKVSVPVTVGLPVNVKALVEPALNSRLPKVTPEMLLLVPVMLILPPVLLACVPVPVMLPANVITFPASLRVPAVRASAVRMLKLLPIVAVCPALFNVNVVMLSVEPAVVGSKYSVPKSLVEFIVRLEVAPLPEKYCVADIPTTVPLSVNVNAPIDKVLFAPVKVSALFIVALPVNANALAEAALNSTLPRFAPDIVEPTPVMLILPPVLLLCVPAPAMFPEQVITFPPSATVPVSVSVVLTLKLLPSVVVPALAVNTEILFVVPGVV